MLTRGPTPRRRPTPSTPRTLETAASNALSIATSTLTALERTTAPPAASLVRTARVVRDLTSTRRVALDDVQALAVDDVRVCGNGGVVALRGLPVNEGRVLRVELAEGFTSARERGR